MASSQTTTLTLPEMRALAGGLHGRGTSPIGPDSPADQRDMLVAGAVIRALLCQFITAAETAGNLARQLSGVRVEV